jgi:hypothetical protein
MALVEKTIESIDVPESPEAVAGRGANQPQLEVYPLNAADPRMVVDMLNATVPGMVMYEDLKTRRINVYASAADQEQVRAIIKQLDGGAGESVTVVPLKKLEPVAAATSLRSLFAKDAADAPSIEPDAVGRRLMVRGSPEQVAEVRKVLEQLGEDGSGGERRESTGGPLRTIDLSGRDPEIILEMVSRMMESQGRRFKVLRSQPERESGPVSEPLNEAPQRGRASSMFERRTSPRPVTEDVEGRTPSQSIRERSARSPESNETDANLGAATR